MEVESFEKQRGDDRAALFNEREIERPAVGEAEVAVEREALFDSLHLDHQRALARLVGGPKHGRRFDGLGARLDERRRRGTVDLRQHVLRPLARRLDLHVRRHQLARLARDDSVEVLNHRAQRDDAADAHADAEEEEEQTLPRRAQLASREVEYELQGRAASNSPAVGLSVDSDWRKVSSASHRNSTLLP